MLTISPPTAYRRGSLKDVSGLRFAGGLFDSGESPEFHVVGMGHEFSLAVQGDMMIGIIVLGKGSQNELRIMYLEVAPARKNEGVGSALLRALIAHYPEYKLSDTLRGN